MTTGKSLVALRLESRFAPVLLALAALLSSSRALAQAEVRNLTQPIPVVNTGGHSAPIRALVFAPPDGARLLSAGFDKIVNVWNLSDSPPGLARTIRPRIWRGYAGTINAMALAPQAEADGQRLLAVAGFGVNNSRGEINLFRFPGSNNSPTGDILGELAGGAPNGHSGPVLGLAFDPAGRYLASASSDRTVRIWDLSNRTSVAVLAGHTQPVNAVAYLPAGRRLVTGGADGLVKLWDVARRVQLASTAPDPRRQRAGDPTADAINTLGVSPDGRWVVIGRENGDLIRYNAANLANPVLLPRGAAGQGAVETLAISHDGKSLVSSVVSFGIARPGDRPRVDCDIELRRMPDGAVLARLARTSNLAYACAFSPDDRRLAFAGGDTQGITIIDLADANRRSFELAGQGSSLWDVGFSADSRSIGYSRQRPDLPNPPEWYYEFDLSRNRVTPFNRTDLARALNTWNGWTVRPVDPWTLDVLNAQNQGFRLRLDPLLDRRWWSYSFVPPGPGHPRAAIAVGCEAGVSIHRLDDGRRTRLFAGHNGPVYALAPSPDGRWLVTGSSDQTARLWRLADCDTLAPLGARFTPAPAAGGRARVSGVDRWSFAEAMDLQVGDEVEAFYIGGKKQTDLAAVETVVPNTTTEFLVRRAGQPEPIPLGTTKRNAPALTLFPALDREWVVWTPQGYYDTSAIGDRRYLGWHRNRAAAAQPTDYFSFDRFENDLRRPEALLRYLQTADRAALLPAAPPAAPAPAPVVRQPERLVVEDVLPQVAVLSPVRPPFAPLVVPAGDLTLRVRAASEDPVAGRGLIRSILMQVDGGRAAEVALAPPLAEFNRDVVLTLGAGRHRVSVTASNDRARERTETFDVIAEPPPPVAVAPEPVPVAPPARLVILGIGSSKFAGPAAELPLIPFANEDIRDLVAFLGATAGAARHPRVESRLLIGPEATFERIEAAFQQLDSERGRGEFERGDAVFLVIESHFVDLAPAAALVGCDARGRPPAPSIPAATIADCLGQLADYGCKVVLLVDPHHESRPVPGQTNRALIDWSRALYRKNIITFVASIHGPSQRLVPYAHGAFAQAVLDATNVRGQARLAGRPASELTLFDFQDVVSRNVLALTNRQQFARCYIPETIPSKVPLFEPPARTPGRIGR